MNKKVLVVVLLVALFCINGLESRDCDCGWTSNGCGRDDGSYCWVKCCDKRKRNVDVDNNKEDRVYDKVNERNNK